MRVEGKVALITGAASGLGEATLRELVGAGARAAILDRPQSRGAEVAAQFGDRVIFTPADVTREDEVGQAVEKTIQTFGTIHICVNCAGTGAAIRTVTRQGPMPLEVFVTVIQINLVGTFDVLRRAAAQMATNEPDEEGERGVIINTASTAAFDGQIGQAAYSASKAGVVGMTLPIARDLASLGIRVNTIAPGTFDTPLLALLPEPQRQALAANIPFPKRLGRPAEFAALVRHIVENPYINAETIRLDAGLRMPPK